MSAQRHYLQIPQHYREGQRDPSRGFPKDRETAKRMKREGNETEDGGCRFDELADPPDSDSWAYELTAKLPPRHRMIAERVFIQGESNRKARFKLGTGASNYESICKQTKELVTRLIER